MTKPPSLNAAAITRRLRAAGLDVTSHRDPQHDDAVRVVPFGADEVAAARQVVELLTAAGYAVELLTIGPDAGDAVRVRLPQVEPVEVDQETGDTFDADGLQVGNIHDGETEPGAPLAPAADELPPLTDAERARILANFHAAADRLAGTELLPGSGIFVEEATPPADSHHLHGAMIERAEPVGPTRRQLRAAARRDRTARRAKARTAAPRIPQPRRALAAAVGRSLVVERVEPGGAAPVVTFEDWQTRHGAKARAIRAAATAGELTPAAAAELVERAAQAAATAPEVVAATLTAAAGFDAYADELAAGEGESDRVRSLRADAAAMRADVPAGPVVVEVSNAYACGRESSARVTLDAVPPVGIEADDDAVRAWLDLHAYEHTGDGHTCGAHEDAVYGVAIVEAPGRPELVGLSAEL